VRRYYRNDVELENGIWNEERLETVNEGYAKAQMKGDGLEAEKRVKRGYTSVQFKSSELGTVVLECEDGKMVSGVRSILGRRNWARGGSRRLLFRQFRREGARANLFRGELIIIRGEVNASGL